MGGTWLSGSSARQIEAGIETETILDEQRKREAFEKTMMPHLQAAYNLARWLAGNDSDAQDVVQETYLRAFKFFDGFRGGNSRSWLLRVVRNAFYDWLKRNRREEPLPLLEADLAELEAPAPDASPLEKADYESLERAIAELPLEYREILVLRELEDLSYKEIATLADLPIGTVMSRLARARERLRTLLLTYLEVK